LSEKAPQETKSRGEWSEERAQRGRLADSPTAAGGGTYIRLVFPFGTRVRMCVHAQI